MDGPSASPPPALLPDGLSVPILPFLLRNVNETLECVCGTGLVQLDNASVSIKSNASFAGSVVGGTVSFKKIP